MTTSQKRELVKSYLDNPNYNKVSYSELARIILVKYPELLSFQRLRELISKVARNLIPELEISIPEPDSPPYSVSEQTYFFNSKRGKFSFPVTFIDNLFYEFSEKGLDLSGTEVMNKYELEPYQWHHIKFVLNLYKKSHIFSPYTVENTPREELGVMIENKMNKLFSSVQYQVEKQYEKVLLKRHKEELKKFESRNLEINTIISELQDLLTTAKIKITVNQCKGEKRPIVVHLADLHFGAESRNSNLPVFSPEILKQYLKDVAFHVNSLNSEDVTILFIGDQIESFSGLNHIDSWKGIAKGYYGSRLVIECYKCLAEFISSINNIKTIYGISGNHDRAAANNKEGDTGFIGELIFEFLRITLDKKIEVIYDEKILSTNIDGIQYIMTHGDKGLSNLTSSRLILDYGKQGIFNLLVSGHVHERRIKEDHQDFRQLVCPSIFPGNDYSINLGYSTAPGFLISFNNGNGKPIVIDYTL